MPELQLPLDVLLEELLEELELLELVLLELLEEVLLVELLVAELLLEELSLSPSPQPVNAKLLPKIMSHKQRRV